MSASEELGTRIGMRRACKSLGVSHASVYRRRRPGVQSPSRPPPPLALTPDERERVMSELHSERFIDQAPRAVFATLLDEGVYLASVRTMYRLLGQAAEPPRELPQARVAGHWAEPAVELGYHQAQGASEVALLLSVRHLGRIQPLRGRVDGR